MKTPNYRLSPAMEKFLKENWNKENPTTKELNRALMVVRLLHGFISNYQFKHFKEDQTIQNAKEMEDDILTMAILKFNKENPTNLFDEDEDGE